MADLKLGEFLGLGSAGAFLLTIVYLYGYSWGLGVNLYAYFSLNDYLRQAVEWLPPLLGTGISGYLAGRFFTRVERGATEEEIAARSNRPRAIRRLRRFGEVAPPATLVLLAAAETIRAAFAPVPVGRLYLMWGGSGALLWLALVHWYAKEPRLVAGWSRPFYLAVALFPTLAISALGYGLSVGADGRPFYSPQTDAEIWVRGETSPTYSRVLFVLDEFFVLRVRDSTTVVVIPRAEVTKVSHPRVSDEIEPR